MMRKIKKLGIDSLIKKFELLDEKQNAGTLGGSYYYDENTGAFLGSTNIGNEVRFLNSIAWSYIKDHEIGDAGVLFSDASVNPYAKEALLRSFLPASAQNVYIGTATTITNNAAAAFISGPSGIIFGYNPLDSSFNDYNNLQSVMIHENYHWNNGHIAGTSNYSGYTSVEEVTTIMAQINDPSYQGTTDDFKIRTAKYLYQEWDSMKKDTPGYTLNDAYRIAGVEGYADYRDEYGYGDYRYEYGGYGYGGY